MRNGSRFGGRQVSPAYAWYAVGVLVLLYIFSMADRQVIAMVVDPLKSDLGLSEIQVALLQGFAFVLLYATAGIPLGWAVDRYSPRLLIFQGVLFWSVCTMLCGLSTGFWSLFLARVGVGIGEATLTPAAYAIIGRSFPKDRIGLPTAIYMSNSVVGTGAAFALSGMIISGLSGMSPVRVPLIGELGVWQSTFILMGAPGLLLCLLALSLPRFGNEPGQIRAPITPMLPFIRTHWVLLSSHFVAFALIGSCVGTMLYWGPAAYARMFDWTPAEIGWKFGLTFAIGGPVCIIAAGAVADRLFRAGILDAHLKVPIATTAIGAVCLIIGLLLGDGRSSFALAGVGVVVMVAWAGPGGASLQLIAPPSLRGRLTAIWLLTNSLIGSAAGPLIVAAITEHVYRDPQRIGWAMVICITVAAPAGIGLLLLALPRVQRLLTQSTAAHDLPAAPALMAAQ